MCGPHHCLGRDAFASGPEILRRLLQLRQNASILEQGCTSLSPDSANRKHQITRHPWRTSPPLRPSLSFRYTQVELRNYFASNFDIEDLRGLDLFHSRFAADPRWNPVSPTGDSEDRKS